MMYTESSAIFDQIASYGIPIRDPDSVMVWARRALFDAYRALGAAYRGTVAGVDRLSFIPDDLWWRYVNEGLLMPALNREKCRSLWDLFGYPSPVPSFTGSVTDMERMKAFEDEDGFGCALYSLFKKRVRLLGLCGSWLRSYRDGRLYYGSLHPFACSTGRCAPCPSDGFLPGMGREVTKALLNPPKGREISILDYKAQGLCILAALSHDPMMTALARAKKDPYLGLGKILGLFDSDIYGALDSKQLKGQYGAERDRFKRLMLAYQYGAGAKKLCSILPSRYGIDLKKALDYLFRFYVMWKKALPQSLTLPDGFEATGASPSVTHVQGTDSYILRRIVTEIDLPESAFIIATNHDCIWLESQTGFDVSPIAKQMEAIADDVCHSDGLFRVDVETIAHS